MTGGLAPGTLLAGRYRVVRLLAEGGMGAVYEAQQLELGRRVAIKTLLSELQEEPRLVQRFIREARATCMIAHPNVVSVLDVDQTLDGIIFIVMEHLAGADLGELLERDGPIAWPRARALALQVCAALGAAHERGVVHRDLKPSNCFVVRDEDGAERVKVLDFGIAKVLESSASRDHGAGARGPGTGRDLRWLKTSTGEVFGTLAYMAPEHLNGDPHDQRVDIYALGVILYELLTGATPFSPDAPGTFIQQVLFDPPEPPSRRAKQAIPPDLDYVVLRALEKRPEDRFASMDDLAAALDGVRREAAPAIAAPAWAAGPVLATNAMTTMGAGAARPVAARPWLRAGLVLIGLIGLIGAVVLSGLVVGVALGTTPTPGAGSGADLVAPEVGESTQLPALAGAASAVESAPESAQLPGAAVGSAQSPASESTQLPAPESMQLPTLAEPVAPAVASSGPASAVRPRSARAPVPARELPPMTVTAGERQALFAGHRDAIASRCKRGRGLENALLVLEVTIEAARIVGADLRGDQDKPRQVAARCIEKYLRGQVKLPRSLSGRASFSYAF